MRALIVAGLALSLTAPVQAQDSLRDRIERLAAPPPVDLSDVDPYADEKAADLERIAADAGMLFEEDTEIVLFVGPDCAECAQTTGELSELTARLGLGMRVLDIAEPAHAALMERMTFDALPSYVMRDKLIRGQMPIFVLERYLTPLTE